MTYEERERIISDDYADLIIEYNGNLAVLDVFADDTINILDFRFAIVHIPVARITSLRTAEYPYSAIPACFGTTSEVSLEASGINRLRKQPNFNLRGQGTLIGIIDTGIDYTNPVFRYPDGTTRIAALWDQTIFSETQYPANFNYGTEYRREIINEALASDDPYSIVPSVDEDGHGTMIASIAGGRDNPGAGFYGVATDAEFVIVKLKQAKPHLRRFFSIPSDVTCFQENDIMMGVSYLTRIARELGRPLSLCIALGSSHGAHDGTSPISDYLAMIADIAGNSVVVSAGNEGNARSHYFGVVDVNEEYETVELNVAENEQGFLMEIWANSPNTFALDILTPTGEFVPRVNVRIIDNREVTFIFEQTVLNIDYIMAESQTGDQLVALRFFNPTSGIWRFRIYRDDNIPLSFHIWLPMKNFISPDTYFTQSNIYTTLLVPGTSDVPIVATAYNPVNDSLYADASRGFNRLGLPIPTIAAPGVGIVAASIDQTFITVNGTGAAAAHTAGVAAMLLEWGVVRGNVTSLDTVGIKKFIVRGARRDVSSVYPNRDWGYGILDIFNVFDVLRVEVI